jgi:uncharacterized membrane protein
MLVVKRLMRLDATLASNIRLNNNKLPFLEMKAPIIAYFLQSHRHYPTIRFPLMKTLHQLTCGIIALACLSLPVLAQEQTKLIDFQKHIQPILDGQCIGCHGPKEQKGGLRVDDLEGLRGYIEAGDVEGSTLWTDYLRSQDPDMLMPPPSGTHAGGLSNADLLFIKTWISEGAEGQWQAVAEPPIDSKQVIPATSFGKVWAFQGVLHPAAVHLPIALLAVSSIFVFFSFFNRESCEPVAYHCLWIGALGAVAACATGWSYAVYEGYGTDFGFDLAKSEIDRHRWLGVFVAVFSVLMVPLARSVRLTYDINKKLIWMLAGLILLVAVSVTGFQGGELTYGEDHYAKYFKQLFHSGDSKATAEEVEQKEKEAEQSADEASAPSVSDPTQPPTEAEPAATPNGPEPAATKPVEAKSNTTEQPEPAPAAEPSSKQP